MYMEKKLEQEQAGSPKQSGRPQIQFPPECRREHKFEQLLAESGARDLTLFIKKSIFSGQIKVVKIDKATMDYYIKLTEFHRQFQAVGNNYNQVVRTLKNNFGENVRWHCFTGWRN